LRKQWTAWLRFNDDLDLLMPDRRYTDEEVQQILADAAQSEGTRSSGDEGEPGMTLAEIQRVASEAGLSSTAVVTAAAALDRKAVATAAPRVLGLKSGVADSVSLARPMSDIEWRKFVSVLRDTFEASGREDQVEGRREWQNGNLRVAVESVGTGAILDMRTRKESARGLMRGGLAVAGMSAVFEIALAVIGANPRGMMAILPITATGIGMSALGALQLPTWLSARRRQFAAIGDYARRVTGSDAEE
jgi:hypothetical protein